MNLAKLKMIKLALFDREGYKLLCDLIAAQANKADISFYDPESDLSLYALNKQRAGDVATLAAKIRQLDLKNLQERWYAEQLTRLIPRGNAVARKYFIVQEVLEEIDTKSHRTEALLDYCNEMCDLISEASTLAKARVSEEKKK